MPVKLINVFIVPKEQEEEFLTRWKETTRHFRSKNSGFIETNLHRNTGIGNPTFTFINVALWESAEAWKSTHDQYKPKEYEIPGVKGHPAIFEVIANVVSEHHPLRVKQN
jgi:heme-degrading monooxygenase HmoA